MTWGWPQWLVAAWLVFQLGWRVANAWHRDDALGIIGSTVWTCVMADVLRAGGFWGPWP